MAVRAASDLFLAGPVTFHGWLSNLPVFASFRGATITGEVNAMNRSLAAVSVLTAAIGLALGMQTPPVQAQGMSNPPQVVKDNMGRMQQNKLEKCYGINAAGKNDCAEGAHSCAGQASAPRDAKSFVLLPSGDCSKISGGRLKPA
jgi:uncharacterized membrane protein